MKREIVEWTIKEIYEKRGQITPAEYQRKPRLWNPKDMELLIDSILMNIDIPKLYFYKVGKDEYEIIDGTQRLSAIWGFVANEYTLTCEGGKKLGFNELSPEQQEKILSYKLQIALISDASDKYLRELFLRLQLGLLLVTGEKLHAKTGAMKDFVFGKMVEKPFVKSVKIPNRRYAKETLCAQICINSFTKAKLRLFSRTRYEDLSYFFDNYANSSGKDLDFFRNRCKSIMEVLDTLNHYFDKRTDTLRNRSFILSIYLFVEELVEKMGRAGLDKLMPNFADFVLVFLQRLKEETKLGIKRTNEDLYKFELYLSNAPGEAYQIERRHGKLKEFFEYFQKTNKIKGD